MPYYQDYNPMNILSEVEEYGECGSCGDRMVECSNCREIVCYDNHACEYESEGSD